MFTFAVVLGSATDPRHDASLDRDLSGRSGLTGAKGYAKASSRGQGRDVMPGLMAIAIVDGHRKKSAEAMTGDLRS